MGRGFAPSDPIAEGARDGLRALSRDVVVDAGKRAWAPVAAIASAGSHSLGVRELISYGAAAGLVVLFGGLELRRWRGRRTAREHERWRIYQRISVSFLQAVAGVMRQRDATTRDEMARDAIQRSIGDAGRRLSIGLKQDCEVFLLVRDGPHLRAALDPEALEIPGDGIIGRLLEKTGPKDVHRSDICLETADENDLLSLHKAGYRQLAAVAVCSGPHDKRRRVAVMAALANGSARFGCPETWVVRQLAAQAELIWQRPRLEPDGSLVFLPEQTQTPAALRVAPSDELETVPSTSSLRRLAGYTCFGKTPS
jgi:hypothetical protein